MAQGLAGALKLPARRPGWLLPLAGLAPVALWLLGVFPMDVARVCAGVALVVAVLESSAGRSRVVDAAALVLVVAVPFAFGAHLFTRVLAGLHGVDFAIFTQVVHSVSTDGSTTTTLLGPQPISFMSHHFAPVLFVPGALAASGLPAPLALIGVECASLLLGLLALRRFGIERGLDPSIAGAWALIAALCVSVRPEFLWGVHDELFALAFVGWSLVWLQRGKWWPSLVLLLLAATAKESLFLVSPAWLFVAWSSRRAGPWSMAEKSAALVALTWPAVGLAWVALQPWLSGRPFDHLNKFDLAFLREHPLVQERVLFTLVPLLSFAALPLVAREARRWAALCVPLWALCIASSDPEMFRPTGYHAVVPVFLLAFAGAVGLHAWRDRTRATNAVWALVALQLSFGASSLWLPLQRVPSPPWYPAPELARLVGSRSVAADPAAALALLDAPHVTRLWWIDSEHPPELVVVKPDGWEPVPTWVTERYAESTLAPGWRVLTLKPPDERP